MRRLVVTMARRSAYRSFRMTDKYTRRFLDRFSTAGRLVLAAAVISAMFGINTHINLAYQMFCLLAALLMIAVASSVFFRGRFTVTRHLPRFATVGRPLVYRLDIGNDTRQRQRGLSARERPADPRPSFDAFSRAREPRQERRNVFDRWVGYHRWAWLKSLRTHAGTRAFVLPDLMPGGRVRIKADLLPLRRGRMRLEGLTVSRPDPLGLFRSLTVVDQPDSVTVLPRIYPVNPVMLPGTRRHQPGGVAMAASVGDAEEFVSLRDYRPGDPLRRIHWRSWARTGRPIVKEYQEEYFVRHALILDTFHRVPGAPVFEAAVSVAASLVNAMQGAESLLDLMFVGPQAYCFTAGRGLARTDRMLEILASVDVCPDKSFHTLVGPVMARAGLLSACICVFLAWDDDRRQFIDRLSAMKMPVRVIVLTENPDPTPADDGPVAVHRISVSDVAGGLAAL